LLYRLVEAEAGGVLFPVVATDRACIHQMVENAYKTTLACAFVSLVAGLYRKRANNPGTGPAIAPGFGVWIAMEFVAPEAALPQFVGLIASELGMEIGSTFAAR